MIKKKKKKKKKNTRVPPKISNKGFKLNQKSRVREHIIFCINNPDIIKGWSIAFYTSSGLVYITKSGGMSVDERRAMVYSLETAHRVLCSLKVESQWKYAKLIPVRKDKLKIQRGKFPTKYGR